MKKFVYLMIGACLAMGGDAYARKKRTPEMILAIYAADCGTNRLAKKADDSVGVTFIAAALKMDPTNESALLTSMLLKRERPVQPKKSKCTEDRFAKLLVKRADGLFKKVKEGDDLGKAVRIYYLLAEKVMPGSKDILLGLAKLEQKGFNKPLEELLEESKLIPEMIESSADESTASSSKTGGARERVPLFDKPKKKVNTFGIGERDTFLERRYGKIRNQKFIVKPNEYILTFIYNNERIEAYFNFGKCRWIKFPYSYWYTYENADLEKKLGVGEGDEFGWKKIGEQKFESKDGKGVAFIDEHHRLNIWEKNWHKKHK